MLKKTLFTLLILILTSNSALADFKYTEVYSSEVKMPGMENLMNEYMNQKHQGIKNQQDIPPQYHQMMQSMFGQMNRKITNSKTFYIKGSKKRVDKNNQNTSTITDCDLQRIIELDHNRKSYQITDLKEHIKHMQQFCSQMPDDINSISQTEKLNPPHRHQLPPPGKTPEGQLTIKTSIIDTKQTEKIGKLEARYYIKEVSISGNPSCSPDMTTKEHLWAANFTPEDLQCPLMMQNENCKNIPDFKPPSAQPRQMDCYKNARIINEGLKNIPGFVVKKVTEVDMMKMSNVYNPTSVKIPGVMPQTGFKSVNTITITDISKDPLPESLFEISDGYHELPSHNRPYNRNNNY
jgi:hypothetical protein